MKPDKSLELIKPHRLKVGDTIGIVAPADPVRGFCSDQIIERGYEYLRKKGFAVLEGESMKKNTLYHTAGSVEERVADIHSFLRNDKVKCIMAFWGGLNSNQLLDYLDYELIKAEKKIIIGYSDVTALTTGITTKTGLVTFSGPAVISFAKPQPFDYTWSFFERILVNPSNEIEVVESNEYADDLYFLREDDDHRIFKKNQGIKLFNKGYSEGAIIAGNLQTLLLLSNTEYLPSVKDKILFIEEDESSTPAHIDRFFCQMKHLGWLNQIAGLVVGRFTEHSKFSNNDTFEDILNRYLGDVKYPVIYNVDFGHSDPMITIPNGGTCIINNTKVSFRTCVI